MATTPADRTLVTRTNLDLMRAVAVTCVLFDHTVTAMGHKVVGRWDFGWLGLFGVYLFFVHTCLVLMWSLERRPHTLDFYVRRIFRIYPLAMVVILVMVAFHLQDFPPPVTPKVLVTNLLLVTNLFGTLPVTIVLWSLLVEVQMYLVVPVLFLFARRERVLWPFLLFWACWCKILMVTFGHTQPVYSVISNAPFFLPGVIAYVGYMRRRARWPAALFPVLLLAMGVAFELAPSVVRGWVLTLGIGLLLPFFCEVQNRAVVAATHQVAKYSYGIYLLHPMVLLVVFHRLPLRSNGVKLGLELVSVGALSVLAYHLVEHPLMRLGSRVANQLQSRYGTRYAEGRGLDLS